MPGTLKVMSWNLLNFGSSKMNDDYYNTICYLIHMYKPDIVGLMEIVGGYGDPIADNLKKTLNAFNHPTTPCKWDAVVSDQFLAGGHSEQYVILYNTQTNLKAMNSYGLVGIINDHDFNEVYTDLKITQDSEKDTFIQTLLKYKYIDASFRVPQKTWKLLNSGTAVKVDEITKDTVILDKIKQVLLKAKPYVFPGWGSRTPFNCNFTLPNNQLFSVYLFHAPAPPRGRDVDAYYGNNHLGLITELNAAHDTVVMGDFNIKQSELDTVITYGFLNTDGEMEATTEFVKVFQTLTGPDLSGYPFLKYVKVLDQKKTSLVQTVSSKITDPETAYSSEYDNFFLLRKNLTNPVGQRIESLSMMTSPLSLVAEFGVRKYKDWYKIYGKRRGARRSRIVFPDIKGTPLTLEEAFYVFRYVISDHAPVLLQLDYA